MLFVTKVPTKPQLFNCQVGPAMRRYIGPGRHLITLKRNVKKNFWEWKLRQVRRSWAASEVYFGRENRCMDWFGDRPKAVTDVSH